MTEKLLATEEALDMIDDIESLRAYKLTDKERQFFISVRHSKYLYLTEKMTKWLNLIYNRVMK